MLYSELPILVRGTMLTILLSVFWCDIYILIDSLRRKSQNSFIFISLFLIVSEYYLMQFEVTFNRSQLYPNADNYADIATGDTPAILHIALVFIFFVLNYFMMKIIRNKHKTVMTVVSIKEALDALPTGICFYTPKGQVILRNDLIDRICNEITGRPLLNANYFTQAIFSEGSRMTSIIHSGDKIIVRAENSNYYIVTDEKMNLKDMDIRELKFTDVTKEYRNLGQLHKQEEHAKELSDKIHDYRNLITGMTITQETLNAKIRIHDELGEVLLALYNYLVNGGSEEDLNLLINLMKRNITILNSSPPAERRDAYSKVLRTAKNVGVTVNIKGELPQDEKRKQVVAYALHECVTNTLRHAKGDTLNVEVSTHYNLVSIIFTNNGTAPTEGINETGGLANLRHQVEGIGGFMTLESTPVFRLRLVFNKEEY